MIHSMRERFVIGALFTSNDGMRAEYGNIFQNEFTFVGDDATEQNLAKIQSVMHNLHKTYRNCIDGHPLECLIVIDDCPTLLQTGAAKRLACNGINDNVTLMVGVKEFIRNKTISAVTIAENCDYFVLGGSQQADSIQMLHAEFWSDLGDSESFQQLYAQMLNENTSFVWTMTPVDVPTEKYFTYKPIQCSPDFKLHSPMDKMKETMIQIQNTLNKCKRKLLDLP